MAVKTSVFQNLTLEKEQIFYVVVIESRFRCSGFIRLIELSIINIKYETSALQKFDTLKMWSGELDGY